MEHASGRVGVEAPFLTTTESQGSWQFCSAVTTHAGFVNTEPSLPGGHGVRVPQASRRACFSVLLLPVCCPETPGVRCAVHLFTSSSQPTAPGRVPGRLVGHPCVVRKAHTPQPPARGNLASGSGLCPSHRRSRVSSRTHKGHDMRLAWSVRAEPGRWRVACLTSLSTSEMTACARPASMRGHRNL